MTTIEKLNAAQLEDITPEREPKAGDVWRDAGGDQVMLCRNALGGKWRWLQVKNFELLQISFGDAKEATAGLTFVRAADPAEKPAETTPERVPKSGDVWKDLSGDEYTLYEIDGKWLTIRHHDGKVSYSHPTPGPALYGLTFVREKAEDPATTGYTNRAIRALEFALSLFSREGIALLRGQAWNDSDMDVLRDGLQKAQEMARRFAALQLKPVAPAPDWQARATTAEARVKELEADRERADLALKNYSHDIQVLLSDRRDRPEFNRGAVWEKLVETKERVKELEQQLASRVIAGKDDVKAWESPYGDAWVKIGHQIWYRMDTRPWLESVYSNESRLVEEASPTPILDPSRLAALADEVRKAMQTGGGK